jgi:hypothetical protein
MSWKDKIPGLNGNFKVSYKKMVIAILFIIICSIAISYHNRLCKAKCDDNKKEECANKDEQAYKFIIGVLLASILWVLFNCGLLANSTTTTVTTTVATPD